MFSSYKQVVWFSLMNERLAEFQSEVKLVRSNLSFVFRCLDEVADTAISLSEKVLILFGLVKGTTSCLPFLETVQDFYSTFWKRHLCLFSFVPVLSEDYFTTFVLWRNFTRFQKEIFLLKCVLFRKIVKEVSWETLLLKILLFLLVVKLRNVQFVHKVLSIN